MTKFLWTFMALLVFVSCSQDDDAADLGRSKGANRLSTGDSARDFLTEERFSDLLIELVYVQGQQPEEGAVDNLVTFINDRCYKSGGIEINQRSIPSPGKQLYTIEQVDSIEKQLRTQFNYDKRLTMFVFYLDGAYEKEGESSESSTVLGVAYRNTSFVVFKQSMKELIGPTNGTSLIHLESTVLRHEFSHLLGLVNVGTTMQTDHIDPENGHHCMVEDCLMNHLVESGWSLEDVVSEDQIPQLDSYCLEDLRANGGK